MRKILILIVLLSGLGMTSVFAQNPIPSYNVPVYHVANFQEQSKNNNVNYNSRYKRAIIITANGAPSSIATVYVYSLDLQDILGPFTLMGGETISVEIDSRDWGVLVESDDHITVDVRIE